MTATAAAPAPPINDNYLESLNLNKPGTPLDRVDTLSDVRDTTAATVQSDIFSPPSHGGPTELTGCNGDSESRTIWYDFYPDANGLMRIRTSAAFGTIMAVMPFDPKTLLPDDSQSPCAVNQPTMAGELFHNVQAGKSYTVQVGGVNGAGGLAPVPVRLPRPAEAPAGRSDARGAPLCRRGARGEPRRQAPPRRLA